MPKKINVKQLVEDAKQLSFEEYLQKYYAVELSGAWSLDWHYQWELWMTDYVHPAQAVLMAYRDGTLAEPEDSYLLNFDLMDKALTELQLRVAFSAELNSFLSLLAGTGFFKEDTLSEWISKKKWPSFKATATNELSMLEIAQLQEGENYIKAELLSLKWWQHHRPFLMLKQTVNNNRSTGTTVTYDCEIELNDEKMLYFQSNVELGYTYLSVAFDYGEFARIVYFNNAFIIKNYLGKEVNQPDVAHFENKGVYKLGNPGTRNLGRDFSNDEVNFEYNEYLLKLENRAFVVAAKSVVLSGKIDFDNLPGKAYLDQFKSEIC